jgi:hypothetical protein
MMRLAAANLAVLGVLVVGSARVEAQSPTPTPTAACASGDHTFTFTNNCSYSIWLAQEGNSITDTVPPQGGDWEISSGESTTVCMPNAWRGRFWPRTGCDFESNYPSFTQCTTESDCASGESCYGAICLPQCNPPNNLDAYCQGASGLSNPNATCTQVNDASPATTGYVCTVVPGNVCATGDCGGLLQCFGEWADTTGGTLYASEGGLPPTTLIEPTLDSGGDDNYDVSLASGYNVFTKVSIPQGSDCPVAGCTSELLGTCPDDLQVTVQPGSSGTIPCGSGTYCESGVCVQGTCILGCNDPCDQCTAGSAPGLDCSDAVSAGSSATNEEMYCAKGPDSNSMASCNSGTPVCFWNDDCPPITPTCTKTGVPPGAPDGAGYCTLNGVPDAKGCVSAGDACGLALVGWPGVAYVCTEVDSKNGYLACLPPTTSGLGTLVTPTSGASLWSGCAGVFNDDWVTAARSANGGNSPFYISFKKACPYAYAWQYDDQSSDFSCPDANADLGFQIDFCAPAGAVECSAAAIARGDPGCRPTKMRSSKRTGRSGRTPHGLAP